MSALTQRAGQSVRTIGSRFAVLFLMLAVLLQAGVIETHNHLASTLAAATSQQLVPANVSAATIVASGKSQPATPACPLCEERALFGSYMPAVPVAVIVPVAIASWYAPARLLSSAGRQVSHAWRSRAPPIA